MYLRPGVPNPFVSRTTISYSLNRTGPAELAVYDLLGRRVTTLVDGPQGVGSHTVGWDGRNATGEAVASGVYFVRLQSGDETSTQRIVLRR